MVIKGSGLACQFDHSSAQKASAGAGMADQEGLNQSMLMNSQMNRQQRSNTAAGLYRQGQMSQPGTGGAGQDAAGALLYSGGGVP